MMSLTGRILRLSGAVVLAGVAGTIYYVIKKKLDVSWCVDKVIFPAEYAGLVIGRKGAHVKLVESKTQAKIFFSDEDSKSAERVCIIRGTEDSVKQAKALIVAALNEIQTSNNIKRISAPNEMVGYIIGSGGYFVKDISSKTGARIDIERRTDNKDNTDRSITIRGTERAVAVAHQIIIDKMEEVQQRLLLKKKRAQRKAFDTQLPTLTEYNVAVQAVISPTLLYVTNCTDNRKKEKMKSLMESMCEHYDIQKGGTEADSMRAALPVAVGTAVAVRLSDAWCRAVVMQQLTVNSFHEEHHLNTSRCGEVCDEECLSKRSHCNGDANSLLDEGYDSHLTEMVNGDCSEATDKQHSDVDGINSSSDWQVTSESKLNDSLPYTNGHEPDHLGDVRQKEEIVAYRLFLVDKGVFHVAKAVDLRELRADFLKLSHQAQPVILAGVREKEDCWLEAMSTLNELLHVHDQSGTVTVLVQGYSQPGGSQLNNNITVTEEKLSGNEEKCSNDCVTHEMHSTLLRRKEHELCLKMLAGTSVPLVRMIVSHESHEEMGKKGNFEVVNEMISRNMLNQSTQTI